MQCPDCQSQAPGWPILCPDCQNLLASLTHLVAPANGPVLRRQPGPNITRALGVMVGIALLVTLGAAFRLHDGGGKKGEVDRRVLARTKGTPSPSPPPQRVTAGGGRQRSAGKLATPQKATTAGRAHAVIRSAAPANKMPDGGAARRDEAVPPKITGLTSTLVAPEVAAGLEISIEPPDPTLTDGTGLLTLKSYTLARIYIDGQFSGVTPRTVKLLAGEHTISLMADGYEEWRRTVQLRGREQAGVLASMSRKAAAAQLSSTPRVGIH